MHRGVLSGFVILLCVKIYLALRVSGYALGCAVVHLRNSSLDQGF